MKSAIAKMNCRKNTAISERRLSPKPDMSSRCIGVNRNAMSECTESVVYTINVESLLRRFAV
jgi:hypothetical protein